MKKMNVLLMAAAAVLAVACGSKDDTETTETEVEVVEYKLDTASTTLWWKGQENENHFRTGYVDVSQGTLKMQGDSVIEGNFTVDMTTISAVDEGLPAEKIGYLNAHLKDTAFFQVYKYPTVDVKVSGYSDGKMHSTITVLGTDLEKEIPLEMTKTEDGVTFKGKFNLDISETDMQYLESTNEETGEPSLQPVLEFDLNLVLKK